MRNNNTGLLYFLLKSFKKLLGKISFVSETVSVFYCIKDPGVSIFTKILVFLGLFYLISPADFIPDFILILGQLDDAATIATIYAIIRNKITEEHRNRAKSWLNSDGRYDKNVIDLNKDDWKEVT